MALCLIELQAHISAVARIWTWVPTLADATLHHNCIWVDPMGFEPTTSRLSADYSTTELRVYLNGVWLTNSKISEIILWKHLVLRYLILSGSKRTRTLISRLTAWHNTLYTIDPFEECRGIWTPDLRVKSPMYSPTILCTQINGGRIWTDDLKVMSLVYWPDYTTPLSYGTASDAGPLTYQHLLLFHYHLWIVMEIHKLQIAPHRFELKSQVPKTCMFATYTIGLKDGRIRIWTGISGSQSRQANQVTSIHP